MSGKKKSQSAEGSCDRCSEKAVVTCLTCRAYFCMFHRSEHKRLEESHTLQDLLIPQRNKNIRDISPTRSSVPSMKSDESEELRNNFGGEKSSFNSKNLHSYPGSSAQSRISEESEELRNNFGRNKDRRVPSPHPPPRPPRTYEGSDSGYSDASSGSNFSCGPCDACPSATAEFKCRTCNNQFCQSCISDHHVMQEYAAHDVYSLRGHGNSFNKQGNCKKIEFTSVKSDSVSMSWPLPNASGQHKFKVSWRENQKDCMMMVTRPGMDVMGLLPGKMYNFFVEIIDEKNQSTPYATGNVNTEVPPPENLTVEVVSSSATLTWSKPPGVGQVSFRVDIYKNEDHMKVIHIHSDHHTITDLQNGESYNVSVSTVLDKGKQSKPISKTFKVVHDLSKTLSNLGLEHFYGVHLTLSTVLEINRSTLSDGAPQSLKDFPWIFLKKLMLCNINARHTGFQEDTAAQLCPNTESDYHIYCEPSSVSGSINPLDLITAVFHCSDPFLRQEMVTKMALCQFAVPLLLPNCDTQQNTLMLWAMRDIVKKFRTYSTAGDMAFVEGRVVDMNIPMVSFIRLGGSNLAKSQTLNKLLSNHHQHNNVFIHHDMEGGDEPRRISDGLVELSWYLPCGNTNTDLFSQPVAIANLRGDCKFFKTQTSFLSQISAAVFIFTDDLGSDLTTLINAESMSELFLVTSPRDNDYYASCQDIYSSLKIKKTNVIIKSRRSEVEFLKTLRYHVSAVTEKKRMKIVNMTACARQAGIQVDEDSSECVNGRRYAEAISNTVKDISLFKEDSLPLHVQMWQEISQTQEEIYRLKNVDRAQGINHYRTSLKNKINDMRKKQYHTDISDAMISFTDGISQSTTVRLYFLKWLKIQLEHFHYQYPEQSYYQMPQAMKATALHNQSSNYSLGLEHFFRELGQFYECACSLAGNIQARQQVQHLPPICAKILLDGFPVELVDGDASNIPMKWIEAVFNQLHKMVDTNSRIQVVTVVGAQGSGKSILLNTMFGAQFAVSSGRYTKGACMQLIRVSEEFRSEIMCDFIMVINTAGLMAPERELNTGYKLDNELATMAIGLSDLTIINVTIENDAEIKDILQIVVHAFLRMKEVRKKPKCFFVYQNMSETTSASGDKRREKRLEEQLNDMTKTAAKIENMDCGMKFSDVMEFDPDKDSYYIPEFYHGTPPVVNAGYSKAVYELKKNLISSLKPSHNMERNDAKAFIKCTDNILNAVKFENFIFNFRNSFLAEAYATLYAEYEKWEYSFRLAMQRWVCEKEASMPKSNQPSKYQVRDTLKEAFIVLDKEEAKMNQRLTEYFAKKGKSVEMVEEYKDEFRNNVNCLRKEIQSSVEDWLKGPNSEINPYQTLTMQKRIKDLQKSYREKKLVLTEDFVEHEFEDMWESTLMYLDYSPIQDVCQSILYVLFSHFKTKSGHAKKMLSETDLENCGLGRFTVKKEWLGSTLSQNGLQKICDAVIKECERYVAGKVQTKSTYNDTYIRELLWLIDSKMKDQAGECIVHLKMYVCGHALREFKKLQRQIIDSNKKQTNKFNLKKLFRQEFKGAL